MVHVIAAPDKFRGTANARDAAAVVAAAVRAAGSTCDEAPMADGGEGTLEALGGANRTSVVTGPLGDAVEAPWRLEGRTAVIEMACASGLQLAGGAEGNDAMAASTYGTGELIAAAVDAGARRVLIGVGGSATTDGGFGALRALYPTARFRGVDLIVACDVDIPFVEAADAFAAQKGASPAEVKLLHNRLERLLDDYVEQFGVDVRNRRGAGAAGGLAGGLAVLGGELVSGFEVVAEEIELYERLERADLVITGEGFLDAESFRGKVVGGVLSYATDLGVPALVIVGQVFRDEVASALAAVGGDVEVVSLTERFGTERSHGDTLACITEVVTGRLLG